MPLVSPTDYGTCGAIAAVAAAGPPSPSPRGADDAQPATMTSPASEAAVRVVVCEQPAGQRTVSRREWSSAWSMVGTTSTRWPRPVTLSGRSTAG